MFLATFTDTARPHIIAIVFDTFASGTTIIPTTIIPAGLAV